MDMMHAFILFILLIVGCKALGCEYYKQHHEADKKEYADLLKKHIKEDEPQVIDPDSIQNYEEICKHSKGEAAVLLDEDLKKQMDALLKNIKYAELRRDAREFMDWSLAKEDIAPDVPPEIEDNVEEDECGQKVDWDRRGDSNDLIHRQTDKKTYNNICKKGIDWASKDAQYYAEISCGLEQMANTRYKGKAVAHFNTKLDELNKKDTKKYQEYQAEFARRNQALEEKKEELSLAHQLEVLHKQLLDVPPDGNCLFHAVSKQMKRRGINEDDYKQVRKNAASYIETHRLQFEGHFQDETLEQYVQKLRAGAWGNDCEVTAISDYYDKLPIIIYRPNAEPTLKNAPKRFQCNKGARCIEIAYVSGNHYNEVINIGEHVQEPKPELPDTKHAKEDKEKYINDIVEKLKSDFKKRDKAQPNFEQVFADGEKVLSQDDNLQILKRKIEEQFSAMYKEDIGALFDKDNMKVEVKKGEKSDQEYNVVVTYKASDSDKDIKEKENLEKQEKEDVPVEQSEEKQQKVNQIDQPKKDALNAQKPKPKTETNENQDSSKGKKDPQPPKTERKDLPQKVKISKADPSEDSSDDGSKDHADPVDSIIPRSEEEEEPRSSDKADEDKSRALPNIADVKHAKTNDDKPHIVVHEQPRPKVHTGVDKRIAASAHELEHVKKVINEIKVKGFPSVQFVPDSAKTLDDKDKHTMDFMISANEFSPERLEELKTEIKERFKSIVEFHPDSIRVTITKIGSSNALRRLLQAVRYQVIVSYIDRPSDDGANDGIDDDEGAQRRSSQNANNENNMIHIVAPKRKSKSNKSWWFWIIGAIAAAVVLLCCICVCCFALIHQMNQNDHDRAFAATPPLPLYERDNGDNERQNIRHRNMPLYEGDVV